MQEAVAGAGIQVYMANHNVALGSGATLTTTNNSTGANFLNTGVLTINAFPSGTSVVSRMGIAVPNNAATALGTGNFGTTGRADGATQSASSDAGSGTAFVSFLNGAGVIPSGKTLNVTDGTVSLSNAQNIAGTLNINDQATLFGSTFQAAVLPTTGNFHFFAGGGMDLTKGLTPFTTAGTESFTFDSGSLVMYHTGISTSVLGLSGNAKVNSGAVAPVDYVQDYQNSYTLGTGGLILGQNARVTTTAVMNAAGNSTGFGTGTLAAGGGGIHAASGVTNVIISAAASNGLTVADSVALGSTVNLQIGDTSLYDTFRAYDSGARAYAAQTGTVSLTGAVAANNVNVVAGTFNLTGNANFSSANVSAVNLSNSTASTFNIDATSAFAATTSVTASGTSNLTINRTAGGAAIAFNNVTLNSATLNLAATGNAAINAVINTTGGPSTLNNSTVASVTGPVTAPVNNLTGTIKLAGGTIGANTLTLTGQQAILAAGTFTGTAGTTAIVAANTNTIIDPGVSATANIGGNVQVNNFLEIKSGTANLGTNLITGNSSGAGTMLEQYFRPTDAGINTYPGVLGQASVGGFNGPLGTGVAGSPGYNTTLLDTATGLTNFRPGAIRTLGNTNLNFTNAGGGTTLNTRSGNLFSTSNAAALWQFNWNHD